ncbi:MAG: ribonuclease H-like domain-containing protein [Deltaproteobacteria bacterium]|nr:ribonuclease H-like domain-containing protein [Deltaproteobacteria bacterium]MBW2073413.1 ribonuclease H-like domain-containing protein [Deltaproteobacteria bacterium]
MRQQWLSIQRGWGLIRALGWLQEQDTDLLIEEMANDLRELIGNLIKGRRETYKTSSLLEHTFIHIPGIRPKTERHLWQQGILTWGQYLHCKQAPFAPVRHAFVRQNLEDSLENRGNILFFRDRLSSADLWRLFDPFKDRAVYLDIETSGGCHGIDEITVIGLYDGHRVQTFVNGLNLNEFEIAIASYELLITFNGSLFDLPVIGRHFPHIVLPPVHIDLRFFLRKLGYLGGLKAIEKTFFLSRASEIDGMNGYDAVKLWRAYLWGDQSALERLIQYNTADIVHLKPLMETGYEEMKRRLLYTHDG